MMNKRKKVFIACDTTNIKKIKEIINKTQTSKLKIGYKFGLEFLNSKNGRKFVSLLKNQITCKISIAKLRNGFKKKFFNLFF